MWAISILNGDAALTAANISYLSPSAITKSNLWSAQKVEKQEAKKAPVKQKAKSHIAVRVSDSAEDIKSIALKLGGKIIKKEYDSRTNKVKYIVVDVPVKKYGRFIYEIRRIGKLKKAAPKEPVKSRKMQNFKIYLIDQ